MDDFLTILRQHVETEIRDALNTNMPKKPDIQTLQSKLMTAFDRVCIFAIAHYAREKGIDLT